MALAGDLQPNFQSGVMGEEKANRNTTPFKIRSKPMKIKENTFSNRNKKGCFGFVGLLLRNAKLGRVCPVNRRKTSRAERVRVRLPSGQ